MKTCAYCQSDNPPEVFNCLKCSALMPVQPVAIDPFPVAQQRIIRKMQKPETTTATSLTDLIIYTASALGLVGWLCLVVYLLNLIEPL